MDLSRMLTSESGGGAVAASSCAMRTANPDGNLGSGADECATGAGQPPRNKRGRTDDCVQDAQADDSVIAAAAQAAAGVAEDAASPYTDLQRSVHRALESKDDHALTTSDKVALALEVLRARQLELDLAQARNNIEALVTKTGSAPRTLRSVIPASTVKGLPVGTPVEISAGKFLLSPTTNDPQALFLTLELQHFGKPSISSPQTGGSEKDKGSAKNATGPIRQDSRVHSTGHGSDGAAVRPGSHSAPTAAPPEQASQENGKEPERNSS